MKRIKISIEEFKENLRKDPRIKEEYIKKIELPQAFSAGNKLLRKYILSKIDYQPTNKIPSDWFQFSQLIKEIKVSDGEIEIKYDKEKDTHPPLMSRTIGK